MKKFKKWAFFLRASTTKIFQSFSEAEVLKISGFENPGQIALEQVVFWTSPKSEKRKKVSLFSPRFPHWNNLSFPEADRREAEEIKFEGLKIQARLP